MEASAATDVLVDYESAAFADGFARHPIALRHRVSGHPLVAIDAIRSAADDIPAAWATVLRADLPLVHPRVLPTIDVEAGEALDAVDGGGLRVTLYHLEHLSRYRALVDACLAPCFDVVTAHEGPPSSLAANVFVGSPRSVVPAHVDRHHNVLLQVAGTKELTVGWFDDPAEHAKALEARFTDRPNPERLPPVTRTFRLGPGDGVYLPAYTFHWVEVGDAVSVALSCGFSTAATERAELVRRCNIKLRRLGLRPRAPGASERGDRAKAALFATAKRVRGAIATGVNRHA